MEVPMAGVFDVVKQSGRISLDELALRSSGSAMEIIKRVRELSDRGLVRVTGDLPETADDLRSDVDTKVELTERGFRE